MGQRADEIGGRQGSDGSDQETYVVRPGETRFVSAEGTDTSRMIDSEPVAERHEDDIPEAEEIRAEMDATRAELSQTIDAIQDRLAPDELKDQAKDAAMDVAEQVTTHVREAIQDAAESAKQAVRDATIGRAEEFVYTTRDNAREVTFNMMDTIRENPLPAAIVGIGLGWLLMNSSKRAHRAESYPAYQRTTTNYPSTYRRNTAYTYPGGYSRYEGYGGYTGYDDREQESDGIKDRVADAAGQVQERAGQMVSDVGERASNVASSASDMASDVASNATDMMSNAGEFAVDAGTGMWDTIRRNPIPAALAGIGLGWLFMNAQGDQEEERWSASGAYQARGRYAYGSYDYGSRGYGSYDYGSRGYGSDDDSDQGMAGRVADRVGDVADKARGQVGELGSQVSDKVDQLGDQAGEMADQAQYYVERAQGQVERMVQDNPLALGAVAAALGAAIGMAIPGTYRERELMGEARDAVMERAQGVVQEATEKVQHVAQEAGSAAKDAAKQEAKDQGLTSQPAGSQSSGSQSAGGTSSKPSTPGSSGASSASSTPGSSSSYATSSTGSTPGTSGTAGTSRS
jgi:ElaB/YqjD/DUF883 family membrane-anchored ribosome-binding protein